MWTYVARRLLLMIPTLFLISLINFIIINLAPAPSLGNVGADGLFDQSASAAANEAKFVFRQTFNLDKPVLYNDRIWLADDEILWRVAAPLRRFALPADKLAIQDELGDYGRFIVPHLLRVARSFVDGEAAKWRAGYEERWAEARARWLAAGRPSPDTPWPPPAAPPPFDEAFAGKIVPLVLDRLANNAPRRPSLLQGEDMTDELRTYNTEVRREAARLRRIWLGTGTPEEKLAQWETWFRENEAEWEMSFWDKTSMLFLDTRFGKFWANVLTFDLGVSYKHRRKVWDLILERLHISLVLSFGSLLLAYLIAMPLGILSSVTHGRVGDQITTVGLFALYSLPVMFLGVLLLQYFAIERDWFPVSGFESPDYARRTVLGKIGDNLRHVALPMTAMTVGALAYLSRMMKSGLIETIRADFVRTARAKGLSEFVVVMKHAVRNGLIPIITILGASLPALIGGSVIVEFIFGIDGMGRLGYEAVVERDYGVIMGINFLAAILTMAGVFLADLAYALVDPRISYS